MAVEEYKPKAILLTGGAGFIGSNVLCHLVKQHPDTLVVCFDKLDYCASTNNFKELLDKKNFKFVKGDISSPDLVNHVIESMEIDTIMNFAAQTHVDNSFGNSFEFTKTNVLGTHVLLESAKRFKDQVKRFIHVSTDEVYGESSHDGQRNTVDQPLNPTNPYAATKTAAEFLVKSYRTSFKLPTIITRGNNVYGPRQYPEKLIPKFINLLAQGKACPLHGDGSNRRSFLYVSDVANAFDIILRKGKIGEIYNVGNNVEFTNKSVLNKLITLFKYEDSHKYITYVKDRAFNDFRYHIDSLKLEALGWEKKVDFEEGLALTKDWYMNHMNWWGNLSTALQAHPQVSANSNTLKTFDKPQCRSSTAGKVEQENEAPAKKQKV